MLSLKNEFSFLLYKRSSQGKMAKVVEKEVETQKKMAISEAEKNAFVSKILIKEKLMEKENAKRLQHLENEIYLARKNNSTEANANRMTYEAEANKLLRTLLKEVEYPVIGDGEILINRKE